jgi:hypothetical protein
MMWVFLALSGIELAVVHLVVSGFSRTVALALSVVSLAGIAWMVALIVSFGRLPVVIGEGRVLLRVGYLRSIDVPLANIAAIRRHWDGDALKAPGTVNLALIAYPNLLIDLDPPLPGRRREVRAVAHKLDAPDAFLEALRAAMGDGQ